MPIARSSLMAHHDAARTGLAFDQNLQRKLTDWFPGIIERIDTRCRSGGAPSRAPAMVAAGAATRRRGLTAAGHRALRAAHRRCSPTSRAARWSPAPTTT